MEGKITYHQQVSYCGKPQCRKCQEGIGHGPYWYAYKSVNGRTTRTYIGKRLPPDVQTSLATQTATEDVPLLSSASSYNDVVLRIFTLGRFQIERRNGQQWQPVNDTAWQRRLNVRALLALLLCSPGRCVSRTTALETLWPRRDKATASNHLNVTLQSLRKILRNPREGHPHGALLRSEGEYLILADQQDIWVDADVFETLLSQAGVSTSSGIPAALEAAVLSDEQNARVRLLQEALTLHGGDFLPEGQHISWVNEHAQKLRRLWIASLLTLADLQTPTNATSALELLNRLLAYDATNESAVQRLIAILARLKRRGEAMQAYHRLVDVLKREYMNPLPETQKLYEAVRLGQDSVTVPTTLEITRSSLVTSNVSSQPVDGIDEMAILPIGRGNQTPLVGREREIAILRQFLHDVRNDGRQQERKTNGIPLDTQRRPQCVVLLGESGIGKTRLAEETSREARRSGWAVVWSRMYPQESGVPYRIWSEVLNKVLDEESGLLPHFYERLVSANQLTTTHGFTPSLETLRPLVALLPRLGERLAPSKQETNVQPTPEQEQRRLWEAIRDLFILACEHTPLLIVLDDIQWADSSSCELLGYLARSLYGFPMTFVVTCRVTELDARHPLRSLIDHMLRERSLMTLTIEPLSSEQIGQLVTGMLELSDSMIHYIQTHASGIPLFAEEMARTTPPTLPKTISATLTHRVHRLSEACQHLLSNAAVIGGSFEFPLISAIGVDGAPIDEDTILTLLEEALAAGVLTEEGTGTRITYHFWHPLLVTYLYEDISAIRRALLHKRIANILQQIHKGHEEEVAATITHHLAKGDAEPAVIADYAERAGDHAYALSANAEAMRYYWLAAEQLGLAQEQEHTDPVITITPELAASPALVHHTRLLERLAECVMIWGDFANARYLYELILALRKHLPVENPQYEAQVQALLWSEIGRTWRYAANSALAWQCCERAEEILRAAQVVAGPAWVRLRLLQCGLYDQEGAYDEAQRVASEALEFFEHQNLSVHAAGESTQHERITRIQRILQGDPVDLGYVHRLLGEIANRLGQLATGLHHLQTALTLYEQYGYKREIAHVSCNIGYIYLKMARYEQAQAFFRRAFRLAESIDDGPLISVIFSDRGEMAAATGDLQEAEDWYRKALTLLERTKDREYMSWWNAALAPILQELGNYEEASSCVTQALMIGRSTHKNPCIGVSLVALSNIRIMQAQDPMLPSYERARRLIHARQDIKRALRLSGLDAETRARATLALAQTTLLLGEDGQAQHELHQLIERVRQQGFTLVEQQAQKLLAR